MGAGDEDMDTDYIHRGLKEARVHRLRFDGGDILTPAYFPSVSSMSLRMPWRSAVGVCKDTGYPQMLVSAYDLDGKGDTPILEMVGEYAAKGVLLVDSGAFEAHYSGGKWDFERYKRCIKATPCSIYAGYDTMPDAQSSYDAMLSSARDYLDRSSNIRPESACMAILHGREPGETIRMARDISPGGEPRMYAVPEREMGSTVGAKIRTVARIRRILTDKDPDNMLHVLGCGDPVLMALLSYAGADTFDSVDWSRWAIDPSTCEWVGIDRLEFIGCKCPACLDGDTEHMQSRALEHNLLFYSVFMARLGDAILANHDFDSIKLGVGGEMLACLSDCFEGGEDSA